MIANDEQDPSESPQAFPPGANALTRWILAAGALGLAGTAFTTYYGYRSDWWQQDDYAADQPVLFSHHHHVDELRIDCRYCHGSVEESSFAGMPATETCMSCHSGVFTDSPMLAPVVESARTGEPLEWRRVYDLADYVYFDHSAHVSRGIGCTSCHGEIGEQRLTAKAQPLHMSWCLDCHRDPGRFLRAPEQIFSPSAPAQPNHDEKKQQQLAEYYHIGGKHLTDCTICHR